MRVAALHADDPNFVDLRARLIEAIKATADVAGGIVALWGLWRDGRLPEVEPAAQEAAQEITSQSPRTHDATSPSGSSPERQ